MSRIYLSDSDWVGRKELGAVGVTMDLGAHMEAPGGPHEYHTFEKVAQNDPRLTEKGEKWQPAGEKSQITQNSNMKALFCSHTHT